MSKKVCQMKHEFNSAFDHLMVDADRGALGEKLSPFMTRPAYSHTSLEQKKIFPENKCRKCGYYTENVYFKEECSFPWMDPQECDLATQPYLPCVLEGSFYEED